MAIDFNSLQGTKLSIVRSKINAKRYQRKPFKTFFWLIFDLLIYFIGLKIVFLSDYALTKILGGLIAGWATSVLFVWGHDAAHGSLFKNKIVAEVLGTIAMLPSFNMYRLWCYGHNRVHHGFTSMTEVDWIWKPWSPEEYSSKNFFEKLCYRLERAMPTCALHYFLRVWWQKMIRFKLPEFNLQFFTIKLLTALTAVAALYLSYHYSGSYLTAFAAVIIPFIVFNYVIAFFVYLHHTHPEIPYFKTREQWSFAVGGIRCSTVIRMSRISEIMTHYIMVHVPHHVDFRVPFYNLDAAYSDLKDEYGQYITEYKFSWKKVWGIFKQCKVFDYEQQKWLSFSELKDYEICTANS